MSNPYEFLNPPGLVHDAGSAPSTLAEHRITTHDGYLWPVARADMVQVCAIRTRMAEDVRDLLRSGGEDAIIAADDLQRLGWSADQVKCHGKAAIALALTDQREAA